MTSFSLRLTLAAVVGLASAGFAQQPPESKPAGDAIPEQQKADKAKQPAPKKIYTNADLVSPETKPETGKLDSPTNSAAGSDAVKAGDTSTPATQTSNSSEGTNPPAPETTRSPVFDFPKQTSPDVFVIPAGTQIRVNISTGKVTTPVRVGWATPIPALTQMTVEVSTVYYPVRGRDAVNLAYQEVAQLTAVTLHGKHYDLQSDQIPVNAGLPTEVTFTLQKDVRLKR